LRIEPCAYEKGAETAAAGFVANLMFDASNSSTGVFVQLVPSIGYSVGKWVVKFGVPFDSVGASSTTTEATSHRGMGDLFLSVSYTIDAGNSSFTTTALSTAPTGNSATGLGTGQATWNWTNHFDHGFGWITPFVDAGVGNGLNAATGLSVRGGGAHTGRPSRIITIPTEPYMTMGKLAHVDAGIDLDVSSSVNLGVLAYDAIPWGNQTAISRFVQLPSPSPQSSQSGQHNQMTTSRAMRGQRFFEVNAVTQGAASLTRDHGVGASVAISPTRYLELAMNYSHSVSMKLDVVSVTIGTNLTRLFRKTS
jgi:hypothetical protein